MSQPRLTHLLSVLVASVGIAGCGGGGSDTAPAPSPVADSPTPSAPPPAPTPPAPAPTPAPTPSTPPPTTGSPTTTLTASQSSAQSLADSARANADALVQAGTLNGVPIGVLVSPPNALTSSSTQPCTAGGTFTYTFNFASNTGTLSSGDTYSASYNNCSFSTGSVISGSINVVYSRWVSATDYAFDITATGYTVTSGSFSYGPYSYSAHYDNTGGQFSYSYTVNGSTVIGQPVVAVTGTSATISSGTIRTNYGGGWVEVSISNWHYDTATGRPTSGTMTVTAANGTTATITVTNTGYTVQITVNGVTSSYSVPF